MYRDVHTQLREERRKNEKLEAENRKLQGDIAYVAMMADVELDEEKENSTNE
jgi:hypothetical protein